jgi:hypothetical protein
VAQDSHNPYGAWYESIVGLLLGILVLTIGFFENGLSAREFWRSLAVFAIVGCSTGGICALLLTRVVIKRLGDFQAELQVARAETAAALAANAVERDAQITGFAGSSANANKHVARSIELLRRELNMARSPIVLPDPALADIERSIESGHIWIVTEELLVEFGGRKDPIFDFIDVMRENITKGVCYTYIIPDRVPVQNRADVIRSRFQEYIDSQLNFALLTEEQWSTLPVSQGEYLVYGPERGHTSQVFYLLPTERGPRVRQWVRVSPELQDYWIGQTRAVLSRARKLHIEG